MLERQDAPLQGPLGSSFLTLRGVCPPGWEAQAYGTRGVLRCQAPPGGYTSPRQSNPQTKNFAPPGQSSARPGQAPTPRRSTPRETTSRGTTPRYRTSYEGLSRLESPPTHPTRRLYEDSATPKVQVEPGRCRRPPDELNLVASGHLRRKLEFDGLGFSRATQDESTYLRGPLPNPPRRYDVTDLHQKSPVWMARAAALGLPTEVSYDRVV